MYSSTFMSLIFFLSFSSTFQDFKNSKDPARDISYRRGRHFGPSKLQKHKIFQTRPDRITNFADSNRCSCFLICKLPWVLNTRYLIGYKHGVRKTDLF